MTCGQQRALVITVSDRTFAGTYPDRTGPVVVEEPVDHGYDVVLTTGGTGLLQHAVDQIAGGDHAGSAPVAP